jgi:DNA mismatch endonuclease (patch repair protein)
MMDRSANMRAIRSKGMRPELAVRHLVHRMGYRYRLHKKDLPGKPDLVFAPRRKIIFLHGCFWHAHKNCKVAHVPKSNPEYWRPKLERNQARDEKNIESLAANGWKSLVIWECETRTQETLRNRLLDFLQ